MAMAPPDLSSPAPTPGTQEPKGSEAPSSSPSTADQATTPEVLTEKKTNQTENEDLRPSIGPEHQKTDGPLPPPINTTNIGSNQSLTTPPPVTTPAAAARTSFTGMRRGRASEEFDRRYDGPFGRPSLAMTRRRSSAGIPENVDDAAITAAATDPRSPSILGDTAAAAAAGGPQPPISQGTFQPEPPPLNYTLRSRKLAIVLFWLVIVFDSVAMPIALYFGLWYGVGPGNPDDERLSANTVFSIVTAALGGASIGEYFLRFWRLYKKDSKCRVSELVPVRMSGP